jgi:16S rRNA G966 N2-methylase RsmD
MASIRELNRLLSPIGVTPENVLVYGWHRHEAVKRLGWKEIDVVVLAFDKLDCRLAEIDENLIRAELDALECAEQTAERKGIYLAKHPETAHGAQGGGKGGKGTRRRKGTEDAESASSVKVSAFTVDTAEKTGKARRTVEEDVHIGETLDDEIKKLLRGTEVAKSKTDLLRLTRIAAGKGKKGKGADPARALRLAKAIADGKAKNVREALTLEAKAKVAAQAKARPNKALIHKADALDFLKKLAPQSIDLITTDPPYMTDVPDIYAFAKSWVPLALSRLKPTGRAYICTGSYPKELNAYLNVLLAQEDFITDDELVWEYKNTIGPSPSHNYKRNWQVVFHIRGPEAPPLNCPVMTEQFSVWEINAPDGRLGDRYHAWQKPDELCERIIRHASKEGDLVVDCFAGTGSFLLAAAKLGRQAVGCEIDDEVLAIARERGCELSTGVLSAVKLAVAK